MDFPITDLMGPAACYHRLLELLHPDGLSCPRCGAGRDRYTVHRRRAGSPVVDYRCTGCRRVFNLFTGTAWQGTRRTPVQILLILRGFAQGTTTARLARELNASRRHLLELRHQVQARAAAAARRRPLPDDRVEADEMFQNAGEKRRPARRPGRPAAAAGQQARRPRHLGQGPAAGLRGGRAHQRAGGLAGRAADLGGGAGAPDGRAADGARGVGVHRRMERVQAAAIRRAEARGGQPRGGRMGAGRRRGRGAGGALQHAGGAVGGPAELLAAVPRREQDVS
jgi:transposase-like protein